MEEIILDEKKYISSKRAAKETGYAKDYIGQLCREGRVPAQVVGRSWYVLESAILDHRFGTNATPHEEAHEMPQQRTIDTWAFPRYEAAHHEPIPTIDPEPEELVAYEMPEERPEAYAYAEVEQDMAIEEVSYAAPEPPHTWTDVIPEAYPETSVAEVQEEGQIVAVAEEDPTPAATKPDYLVPIRKKKERRLLHVVIRGVAAVSMLVASGLALINSGYVDEYIVSVSQASLISGVLLHEK